MEAHLQSLKVPELKSLLQNALLPISGNKADLIKRLLEHPNATKDIPAAVGTEQVAEALPSNSTKAAAPTTVEAPHVQSSNAAAVAPAGTSAQKPPSSVLPETLSTAAAQAPTADDDIATAIAAASPTAPPSTSEQDQATRQALVQELEKRKARAVRFGQEQSEADRKLERAIKFGLEGSDEASMALLHKELAGARKKHNGDKATAAAADKVQTVTGATKELTEEEKAEKEKERQVLKERKQKEREVLEEQKRARAERFGLIDKEEEEKKRKRAEKFGGGATAAANGNEPTEKKIKT